MANNAPIPTLQSPPRELRDAIWTCLFPLEIHAVATRHSIPILGSYGMCEHGYSIALNGNDPQPGLKAVAMLMQTSSALLLEDEYLRERAGREMTLVVDLRKSANTQGQHLSACSASLPFWTLHNIQRIRIINTYWFRIQPGGSTIHALEEELETYLEKDRDGKWILSSVKWTTIFDDAPLPTTLARFCLAAWTRFFIEDSLERHIKYVQKTLAFSARELHRIQRIFEVWKERSYRVVNPLTGDTYGTMGHKELKQYRAPPPSPFYLDCRAVTVGLLGFIIWVQFFIWLFESSQDRELEMVKGSNNAGIQP